MRQFQIVILFLFFLPAYLMCQEKVTIKEIENKFQAFDYKTVIELADSLLSIEDSLSQKELINLLVMKGVSNYSIGVNEQSRKCFVEVLKLNRDFELDPVRISPKIVVFFESIKYEFQDLVKPSIEKEIPGSASKTEPDILRIEPSVFRNRMMRSMILPGWGHLYANQKTKGWILTSASVVNAAAMVFFIVDTSTKENDYLNESNQQRIQVKYDEYNSSYKIRNALIISYAAIWLYSQIDILFFSDESFVKNDSIELSYNNNIALPAQLNLSFRISL